MSGRQHSDRMLQTFRTRNPATQHVLRMLVPNPRLSGKAADIAQLYWQLAGDLVDITRDGPELTTGLRKLLESKDCTVRQALMDAEEI